MISMQGAKRVCVPGLADERCGSSFVCEGKNQPRPWLFQTSHKRQLHGIGENLVALTALWRTLVRPHLTEHRGLVANAVDLDPGAVR
jgi:hypothetical protein